VSERSTLADSPAATVSIILPVRDGAVYLDRCLEGLSSCLRPGVEVVAVDDGSSDASADILAASPVVTRLLRNRVSAGAFAARNRAVDAACGEILFFTDVDCVLASDAVDRIRAATAEGDAVIGVYASAHPNRNFVSLYKNAWIRRSYLDAGEEVDWFFSAVGAVPRRAWTAASAFDDRFLHRTGGGDVEFGARLREAGFRIRLDRGLEVVHLKRFTLAALLANDFSRAYGWSRLGLARRRGLRRSASAGLANVSRSFVAGTGLSGLTLALLALAPLERGAAIAAGFAFAGWLATARGFLAWLAGEFGAVFAAKAVPVLFVDHLACGFGVARALSERLFRGSAA
jgi:glycosyltransferase involved in cell wall biosynthesis